MLKSKSIIVLTLLMLFGFTLNAQKFEYFFDKGQEYMNNKNYKTAVLYFDTAIKLEPQVANTYFNRAIVKDELDDKKGAINDLNSYVVLVPNDADAYHFRGLMKKLYNDTSGAIIDCDLSLLLNPKHMDARILRGRLLLGIDSLILSQEDFTYAYMLDSTNPEILYNKGMTHYYMDEPDSALKYLHKCNDMDTTKKSPYYFISKSYYSKKDYINALKYINTAIRLDANDKLSLVARALIYLYNEDSEDNYLAKEDLYKAVELGSENAKKIIAEIYSQEEEEEEEEGDPN
jgi:tetratricopeptide (TPR) repeat protein